jgi:monoamine oxidase
MSQIETRSSAEATLNDIVKKDFRIAIVGGGMIGLAAAVSLARVGIEVEVFEATVREFDRV